MDLFRASYGRAYLFSAETARRQKAQLARPFTVIARQCAEALAPRLGGALSPSGIITVYGLLDKLLAYAALAQRRRDVMRTVTLEHAAADISLRVALVA